MNLRFVFTAVLLSFTTAVVHAKDKDLTVRVTVFAATKDTTATLLDDYSLASDPTTVLQKLKQLVSSRQAEVVASPVLRTTVGKRPKLEGEVAVELEASPSEAGRQNLLIAVMHGKGDQETKIVTETEVKLGVSKFLGTLEPKDTSGRDRTWLVFVQVH